jgi:carboxyl-terminal processing protease
MTRNTSLILLSAAAGAALTVITTQPRIVLDGSSANAAAADTYRQLALFSDIFERVRSDYVEKPDDGKLVESAINGMLAGLDPHSSYMDPKTFRDMQMDTRGEFGGLGIEVSMDDGLIKVVSPIDETPAAKAGVMANDIITHINDEPAQGLTLAQAVEKMRGPRDTTIKLKITRKGTDKPIEVSITRDLVRVVPVRSHLEDGDVGYIRITQFNGQTTAGLKNAISTLTAQNRDKLKGFIVDLRNNPGGLLDEAIGTASEFLKAGNVLLQKNAQHQIIPVPVQTGATFDLPLVVLINSGTASAAEIVAGALQDGKRAFLIGEKTFGAGTVLNEFRLSDGPVLLLAVEEWLTPAGQAIWHKGIAPNITVPLSREVALLLPPGERNLTPAELRASRDEQLLRALEIITRQTSSPTP